MRKGSHMSDESRAKIRIALVNRVYTPSMCAKISAGLKGKQHPHKGHPMSSETKTKISIANQKRVWSSEQKAKISEASRGERNARWLGGISFEPYCPKFNNNLKRRIRAFFDDQCVLCGKTAKENGRLLCCHHVEYNKQACCDGKPIHFTALCMKCHNKTNGDRTRWEDMIHRIIDEIYDGRSYFTKEEWEKLTEG